MKNVLVLTSTFPVNSSSHINPSVKNISLALSQKYNIYILLPDDIHLCTDYLKKVRVYKFRYFWPRRLQNLAYGNGFIPEISTNPLKIFELLPFILSQIIATRQIIKKYKIDVTIAHWALPSGLSASLASGNFSKTIIYLHGSDINTGNLIYNFLLNYTLKKANRIVTVSDNLTEKVKIKFPAKKIFTVTQGIFHQYKNMRRNNEIIFAGRLIKGKGAKRAINSFRLVSSKHPDLKLSIYGDGPERKILQKYIKNNKISKVFIRGNIPHQKLLDKLAQGKIFLFLSTLPEGLPNTLLEAGISKLPIISTKSIKGLLSNRTAYITRPDVKIIADTINKILSDYKRASRKSDLLYKIIRSKYSIKNNLNKIVEIIENL